MQFVAIWERNLYITHSNCMKMCSEWNGKKRFWNKNWAERREMQRHIYETRTPFSHCSDSFSFWVSVLYANEPQILILNFIMDSGLLTIGNRKQFEVDAFVWFFCFVFDDQIIYRTKWWTIPLSSSPHFDVREITWRINKKRKLLSSSWHSMFNVLNARELIHFLIMLPAPGTLSTHQTS